ncbi:MAG: ROK family protein [Bdellovibrionota bacterium]
MRKPSKSPQFYKDYTVGIDLGGTKVAAALVDGQGRIVEEARRDTVPPWMKSSDPRSLEKPSAKDVKRHVEYVVQAMAEAAMDCVSALPAKKKIAGVGLASAGPMDLEKGIIIQPSNFAGWKTVPLVSLLTDELKSNGLKSKVHFQNDAIAAALGEGWTGVAKGCETYAVITVGTGIGTGVIFNGRPAQSRGMGCEWGHMMTMSPGFLKDPMSFREREVEGIASGTGLAKRARAMGLPFESAADLAKAATSGDARAKELFDGAAEALAGLFYSLSLGFNPEVFAISGGMLAIREHFLPTAIDLYRKAMKANNPAFLTKITIAKLGTKAGVVGAARLPRLNQ